MRIHLLLARRVPDVPSPLLLEVADLLRRRGHEVDGAIPEDVLTRLDPAAATGDDAYLLKSHTETALSLAGALHDAGAPVLNPWAACVAAQDKVVATRRLDAAGVPVPHTWVTGDAAHLADLLAAHGPLVIKPLRGHRGAGVHVLRNEEDLAGLTWPDAPQLVQTHVDGPGEDLKVYVVGERVWAVRKPFSALSFTRPGVPVPVTRAVEEVALRAGEASGLGLFGIDVIESPDGPVVVDLNHFPGYKGCEGVAGPMASYVETWLGVARPRLAVAR